MNPATRFADSCLEFLRTAVRQKFRSPQICGKIAMSPRNPRSRLLYPRTRSTIERSQTILIPTCQSPRLHARVASERALTACTPLLEAPIPGVMKALMFSAHHQLAMEKSIPALLLCRWSQSRVRLSNHSVIISGVFPASLLDPAMVRESAIQAMKATDMVMSRCRH